MQSIEYKIIKYEPAGKNCIEDITCLNPTQYWTSPTGSATLHLTFPPSPLQEISICTNSECTYVITSDLGHSLKMISQGDININTGSKKTKKISREGNSEKLSNLLLEISSKLDKPLDIIYVILKAPRDTENNSTKSVNQTSLNPQSFYPPINSLKLNGTPTKPKTVMSSGVKNVSRRIEAKPLEEQKKIYECYSGSSQQSLKSYSASQPVATCSYQNLFLEGSKGIVVCCKDSEEVQTVTAEICGVLGICYLADLEAEVTHLVYSGFDSEILASCKSVKAEIVKPEWLFQCIATKQALNPIDYIRKL